MPVITNDPPRPLLHKAFYRSVQWLTLIVYKVMVRLQVRNLHRLPMTGGALICPNHVSNMDPMVFGCIATRRVSFLAKKSLFKSRLMSWIMNRLDCIPIDREAGGIGGMKETLRRLKKHESVVMFPEGERSPDGNMLPIMPGFTALVRRVKVPMVPVGIDGTREAWPIGQSLPWFGRVKIVVGESIPFSEVDKMSDLEMADYIGQQIAVCVQEAREWNAGSMRN